MDSSFKEYVHTHENIKQELIKLKPEQKKLRFQISRLQAENKRLAQELIENVEMRLLNSSESEAGQLEEKLRAAISAKNAAVEMWQLALQQLEKLEELLVGKKSIVATERGEIEKQFLRNREEYAKGLNLLSMELSNLRQESSKWKKDLEKKNSELEKCKKNLNSVQEELDKCKKSNSELSERNDQLTEKILSFKSSLSESDKALDVCKEEILNLSDKNAELLKTVSKLVEQKKTLKSQKLIFEKDAKESLQAAKDAVLEKQEIICKEEQYQKKIKLLESSVEIEKEKVAIRFKAEMKDMQKKSEEQIKKLLSEIDHLHKEIGEKQNLFERANREKQALESKVDLLSSQNSNSVPFSNSTFNEMCKQLTMTERMKDELELKVTSLETSLQEVKSTNDLEIQYLSVKQNSLVERLKKLLKDCNQAFTDRKKLTDEVNKFKNLCYDLEKELKLVKDNYKKDISALEEESQLKVQKLQKQLNSTDEHYKNTVSELRKLLEAEFQLSKKWQSEFECFISQSELVIKELNQEKVQFKNSNTDLLNILQQNNICIPNDILLSLVQ